eukprot:TRINITY_DN6286_c2_g1_i1.p1 TRINITY_DN6286_c2_g1~~TRINITY_DN6286_c2_g1_i1.p1  ORF type:complete len:552 (+),score=105.57 TRINITY_DN6286_c2_g1_i1:48-1658(+)
MKLANKSNFDVTLIAYTDWVVTHVPTGLEMLTLPCDLFRDVKIEGEEAGAPCITARRAIEGDIVELPIRYSKPDNDRQTLISVEMLGTGQTISLMVHEHDTVFHLKRLLEGRTLIPKEEQALWNGSVRIDDDHSQLSHCGITSPGAWIRVGKSGKLRLTIRHRNSVVAKVLVFPSETTECLKELIASRTNIPSSRQVLLVAGRELPPRKTLRECRITSNHEITVVLRNQSEVVHPKLVIDEALPLHDRDISNTVETMLGSVHNLVDQQAKLQSTVENLVSSCSIRPTDYTNTSIDMLQQSRQARAAATTEAGAALRMLSQPGQFGDDQSFSHRKDLMMYLSKEARQFSKDTVIASLDRMEQTRQEYNALRNEINLKNLQHEDTSCKLCGHTSKPEQPTTGKPASGSSGTTTGATGTSGTTSSTAKEAEKPPLKTSSSSGAITTSTASKPAAKSTSSPVSSRPAASSRITSSVTASKPASKSSSPPSSSRPSPKPSPKPTTTTTDTASNASDDSVMGDHILGDPEAVEQWLKDHKKM